MKVCYISDFYPPYSIGGAEAYLSRLVQNMSKQAEVVVITTIPYKGVLPEETYEDGARVYRFVTRPLYSLLDFSKRPFISNSIWQLCNFWNLYTFHKIRQYLSKEKPDVVHTHNFKGLSPSAFSAIQAGHYCHVHTVHDYNLINPHSNLMRGGKLIKDLNITDALYLEYMKRLARTVNLAIFPSQFTMCLHRKMGFFSNNCVEVLPNGIALNKTKAPKDYSTIKVLYVGNLTHYKGVHILIKAFTHCSNPNLCLSIVGDGPEAADLLSIAQSDNRIHFYGKVSSQVLDELYSECNLLVFPSLWYEVLPMVIQESMAHGTPVIASALGGVRELVISNYNGYLFTPGDDQALSEILMNVSKSPATLEKLSQNCLAFIQEFDFQEHGKNLMQLYASISKRPLPN